MCVQLLRGIYKKSAVDLFLLLFDFAGKVGSASVESKVAHWKIASLINGERMDVPPRHGISLLSSGLTKTRFSINNIHFQKSKTSVPQHLTRQGKVLLLNVCGIFIGPRDSFLA